jgi:hypothetical protein
MTLPAQNDRWMRELLGETVKPERNATCSNCAMCEGGGTGERPMARFRFQPDIKCCTYQPVLPNYKIGGVLAEEGPYAEQARALMRARMQGGREVNPLWIGNAAERDGLDASLTGMTGVHSEQRCPHLLNTDEPGGTTCSIWNHREAVCSTWWCRYDRGFRGLSFWSSLRFLFRSIEYALSMWCCLEDDLDTDALYLLMGMVGVPKGARVGNEVSRAQLWGAHAGQEEAFYIRCHERVKDLTWQQVLEIGGPTVKAQARHVLLNRDRLEPELPERVTVGHHMVSSRSEAGVVIETYSPYDPILLPAQILPVLYLFDGRPLDEVREQLKTEHGMVFEDAYLQSLLDFNLLVQSIP